MNDFQQKRLQIETRVTEAQDAVEKLVNDHIRTSKATVQAQLAEYAESYSTALVRRNWNQKGKDTTKRSEILVVH